MRRLTTFATMKTISQDICNSIVSLLNDGRSSRQIAVQVGVSHATVNNIRAKTNLDAQRGRGRRPAKLSATDKRSLVRMVTSAKADNATQLKRELNNTTGIDVSTKTVRRALKQAGMKAVTKKKKPRLLARHIRQRVALLCVTNTGL